MGWSGRRAVPESDRISGMPGLGGKRLFAVALTNLSRVERK